MGTGVGDVDTDVSMMVIDQWSSSYVLCPISEEVEEYEEQEDSGKEMNLIPEAPGAEMMKHHVFDEVPESESVGKKLNDDRGEKARERLVAMKIAAFEGQRDDNHAR